MANHVYECLFIFNANSYARDPDGVSGKVPKMVESCGGEVLVSRLWAEQKLAYPINGQRKGTYWLSYFRMANDKVSKFNRACQLNDDVLRNLTLKVDARLADTLVAHALGKSLDEGEEKAADGTAQVEPGTTASEATSEKAAPPTVATSEKAAPTTVATSEDAAPPEKANESTEGEG